MIQVERRAEELTESLIRCEIDLMECAYEMNLRLPQALLLPLLKERIESEESQEVLEFAANHDRFDIQKYIDADLIGELHRIQSESVWRQKFLDVGTVSGVTEVLSSDMIKTGKYGPDIEDYSMPLPAFFPARAGQAKYALRPAIALYESQLHRLEANRVPTTLAEVYVPTFRERTTALYHRLNHTDRKLYRKAIKACMAQEVRRQMLEESVYVGKRRQSFAVLPGLSSHYPNSNYPVPAIVPPENDFVTPMSKGDTYFDRLFGRQVLKSAQLPPVGRKPAHLTGLTFAQWSIRVQSTMKKYEKLSHQFAFDKVEYEADVLGNLLSSDVPEKESSRSG